MDPSNVIWSSHGEAWRLTTPKTLMTSTAPTESSTVYSTASSGGLVTVGGNGEDSGDDDYFDEAISDNGIPRSVCSFPCKTGEIMIMNTVSQTSGYTVETVGFR